MLASRPLRIGSAASGAIELVGRSTAIIRVQELVRRALDGAGGVLFVAERGTDVVSVARDLHARALPLERPFVQVECATRDASALDQELFGTGASPGASPDLEAIASDGCLAAAQGGTLFLHDVGELPSAVQVRLARIMRDREVLIDRVPVAITFRLVASASPGIDDDVHAQRFRPDLYRRMSVTRIDLPALRDRPEDVPALATRTLEESSARRGVRRSFTQTALALLGALTWPGNLAELRAAIERVTQDTDVEVIQVEHLLPALQLDRAPTPFIPAGNLREARLKFERDYISSVLQHCGWRMADAAQALGIQRPNLYRKARQLGIPLTRVPEQLS
jgi:DNA-binding NtrC family response regulator